MASGVVKVVSTNAAGVLGNGSSVFMYTNNMSDQGRFVALVSLANNLVTPATANQQIFRKELPVPYYFAEGTCRPGFEPYLTIQNPGAAAPRSP